MKRKFPVACLLFLCLSAHASAISLLAEAFSYKDSSLVGQGGWVQIGVEPHRPILVHPGSIAVGPSGQDVAKALSAPVVADTVYVGFDLVVTLVQDGDFFLALAPKEDGSGALSNRLYARQTDKKDGYQLGQAPAIVPTYGTEILEVGHTYRVVYAFTTGAAAKIFVDPADSGNESANKTYLSIPTHNVFPTGGYKAIAVIQNVSTNAPNLTIGALKVATSFSEAATRE